MTMSGGPTFVHVPFSPPLLLILAFQPILFHTIVTDGHYMLCFIEDFFFQSRAELFDCGVANDMSKVTHLLVCIVLTPSFCFASSVSFDSFKKFNFVWLRQRLVLLSFKKTTVHLNLLEYIFVFLRSMFAFISLFVDIVRYLTFWHDMIQIYKCSRKKSVDYFVCSVCRYGIDQALFHQLKVFG